ncbi:hypothetical protein BDQ12DRAFT_692858 [Crucibulum laeve]|uniref:Uncharacterized protein n=1 Tax=Crucibulum laeve TaxID=68775 RepID=A0A5C3LH32_9AGAR|nr:hypothetical protein BDQ12DRAFT_692858 [Crucibulum laeve]
MPTLFIPVQTLYILCVGGVTRICLHAGATRMRVGASANPTPRKTCGIGGIGQSAEK